MKNIKKLVSIICILSIAACNANVVSAAADFDTFDFSVAAEENAQEQFDILMNSFVNDTFYNEDVMQIETDNIVATVSESQIEYPDNYAGAYYDSDNKI